MAGFEATAELAGVAFRDLLWIEREGFRG